MIRGTQYHGTVRVHMQCDPCKVVMVWASSMIFGRAVGSWNLEAESVFGAPYFVSRDLVVVEGLKWLKTPPFTPDQDPSLLSLFQPSSSFLSQLLFAFPLALRPRSDHATNAHAKRRVYTATPLIKFDYFAVMMRPSSLILVR